ncbi:Galactinol synthase 4 [Paramyrothecium foliicola]|nr:Galactinol synthase 4 [Paramyrothecium foliicola]
MRGSTSSASQGSSHDACDCSVDCPSERSPQDRATMVSTERSATVFVVARYLGSPACWQGGLVFPRVCCPIIVSSSPVAASGSSFTMAIRKRPANADKAVWTTLITNLTYLPGLLTLEFSLRRVKSAYRLLVLYTDTFPEQGRAALRARGIACRRIPYVIPTTSKDYSNDPRFYDCWTKLTPFSLTDYDRVVQLDADMLVRRNMDELMELELDPPAVSETGDRETSRRVFAAGHACVCNPRRFPHYPKDWTPENCALTHQHDDPEAAQTQGIDPSVGPLGFMNGGLQVVNPSKVLYDQIIEYMEAEAVNMDFADQSLLSDLYRGRWVALPYVYNALKTLRWKGVHDAIWRDDQVKCVHYILNPKPWDEMDESGEWTETDEPNRWWVDMNRERKAAEKAAGVPNDGF